MYFIIIIKNTITLPVYFQTAQHIRNYCISEFYIKLTHEVCSNETYLGIVLDERVNTVKK
jgi:hypothetical protein